MCDTMCVLAGDRVRWAKSSDRPFGEVQIVEPFPRRAGGGVVRTQHLAITDAGAARFVGGRPTWLWGVEHGVNEHRVAIGNERIWTTDAADDLPAALLGMDLVRLGLERGRTAGDAVDVITTLLERHGQGGVGEIATGEAYFSSFLVADPRSAWIVETSGRTWAAQAVDPSVRGASISNRVTLGTGWTRASADLAPGTDFQRFRDPHYPTPHADQRIAATSAVACADPPPTARDLAAVLRHHGGHPWGRPGGDDQGIDPLLGPKISRDGTGVSVCMHLRGWEATTGSMIAELPQDPDEPVRAWTALGNPCVGVFVPVFPDDDLVPAVLRDERTWHRFAVLKARVEAARDADGTIDDGAAALAEVRSVLGPLEASLWDEADDAVAATPGARAALAVRIDARIDAALLALDVG